MHTASTSSPRRDRTSSSRSRTEPVRERTIDPAELGIERCDPAELAGGSPEENARTAREVLSGARGAKRDAVVLNAAGAIAAAGHAADLQDGIALAAEAIDSGRAAERLEELVRFSRESA